MRPGVIASILIGMASGVSAGCPVTDEERQQLTSAVAKEGCSGGKMEFGDVKFQVDDLICADGKTYDFDFDRHIV